MLIVKPLPEIFAVLQYSDTGPCPDGIDSLTRGHREIRSGERALEVRITGRLK